MQTDFYNDIDPFACSWMTNLMACGEIPIGEVSSKSIKDIPPTDVEQKRRVHFFAGIGGWAEALRLANWPENRQVWTGSCPCQPFSNAGKRKGTEDERHLWPEMRRLIAECKPTTIFGEQVASKLGRDWLATVRSDLEALGYAVGCADLCGASVGAPHIRQRLFWVANRNCGGQLGRNSRSDTNKSEFIDVKESVPYRGLANSDGGKSSDSDIQRSWEYGFQSESNGVVDTESKGRRRMESARSQRPSEFGGSSKGVCGLANSNGGGSGQDNSQIEPGPAPLNSWSNVEYLQCSDEKARPVMPGIRLLANGFPNRVGLLRGFGNAIIPQVAAVFIKSFLEAEHAR